MTWGSARPGLRFLARDRDPSFQLCLSPGAGVPGSWGVPQKAGLELSRAEQATIWLSLGQRRWVPLGKGWAPLIQVSPREWGVGGRWLCGPDSPGWTQTGRQLLLMDGTRGPVGLPPTAGFMRLSLRWGVRGGGSALSGWRESAGSPIPLAAPPTPHCNLGAGGGGWQVWVGTRPGARRRQPPVRARPLPQPTRGRRPLPTPGPARHPCNLIPAAAALGQLAWTGCLHPAAGWGLPAQALLPPSPHPAGRRGVTVPPKPIPMTSSSPEPPLQDFSLCGLFPVPSGRGPRQANRPYNLRPHISAPSTYQVPGPERGASWEVLGLTVCHGGVPWGPGPRVRA